MHRQIKRYSDSNGGNKKVKDKIILSIFLIVLLIGIASASLGVYKQGDCVNIKILSNCSEVNITEIGTNNQTFIVNAEMEHLGGQTFNYTFCNTSEISDYTYSWNDPCIDCSNGGCGNSFIVNQNGTILTNAEVMIYLILLIISFLGFGLFLFFGIKIPYSNEMFREKDGSIFVTKVTKEKYFKLLSIWLASGCFMWTITILTGLVNNFTFLNPIKSMATNQYLLFNFLSWGLTIFVIILSFIEIWRDILFNKQILKFGKAILNGK